MVHGWAVAEPRVDRTVSELWLGAAVFLHYGGADENAPLLFVVGVGVLVGLFLAWRRR
jgi:hypothetical protein